MSRTSYSLLALFLTSAIAAGLVLIVYKAELAETRAHVANGGRTLETTIGVIQYAERGVGVPALSIHGAGGGYDQGLTLASEVLGDAFRVIAPSRFGYLGTPIPSDTSVVAQADAHAALLDALNVPSAIVMGTSAGALSAIQFAIRHPRRVRALILIAPASYSPNSPVEIEKSRGSRLAFWLVNAGADFIWWVLEKSTPATLVRFLGVPPEVFSQASEIDQERVVQWVHSVQPLSMRYQGINIDSNPPRDRPALEKIDVPTLIVAARDDLFNTAPAAEFAASVIPQAKLVQFETGGHLLVGRQDEVRQQFKEFLKDVDTID